MSTINHEIEKHYIALVYGNPPKKYDRFIERLDNREKFYLSTGFIELDRLIGGIDLKEENMVIAARTGVGKSWLLLTIAAAASKQGLTVGIYSGEMSVDKVGYRIDTLLGHMPNIAISRGELLAMKEYKNYMDSLPNLGYGSINVLTPAMIAGPATVAIAVEKLNETTVSVASTPNENAVAYSYIIIAKSEADAMTAEEIAERLNASENKFESANTKEFTIESNVAYYVIAQAKNADDRENFVSCSCEEVDFISETVA